MLLTDRLSAYKEAFTRLIFPSVCGICEALLDLQDQGLCPPCRSRLTDLCFGHGPKEVEEPFGFLDQAWAIYPYEAPVSDIITKIKFSQQSWLVSVFEKDLSGAREHLFSQAFYDAVVPIPISLGRLLERHFNQAILLAGAFLKGSRLGRPKMILKKRHETVAQSALNRPQRLVNPWGVFETSRFAEIKDRSFLLIDDIMTTGATADQAARCLKEKGARKVDLLALARALPKS